MRGIDELHTDYPFYGYRRIVNNLDSVLSSEYLPVNSKKIRRLMQKMGIEAIYPKENLSKRNLAHKIYPYLLRGVKISYNRQVYSTDITYVPMSRGFLYLTAVIDWHSRMILSWQLSNTLGIDFCLQVVEQAFQNWGRPKIFNTDQGSQYTSNQFIDLLNANGVDISMDGKGRATDNAIMERFWRTAKRENIYIYDYQSGKDLQKGLSQFIEFYNYERKHQSLNYQTPAQVFLNQ
jgi:putative transposase